MRKNVKLTNKKAQDTPEKEKVFFFVKDQGEGAARIVVIILKVLELIVTSIFGLALGIFAPLCIWFGDFDPEIATNPAVAFWFASAIICIIGTFIVMLGHSKIASIFHAVGAVGVLITYYFYLNLFANIPDNNGPTILYMPLLFLTVLSVVIMLLINVPKWAEKHVEKVNAVAPSILKDEED